MLKFRELKTKEVKIIDLQPDQVFLVSGKKFSFVRLKRGGKSMVATEVSTEKSYSVKIFGDIFQTKTVIGKVTSKTLKEKALAKTNDKSILIKDVKVGETVVIMSNRENAELYTLVEVTAKAYSHTFQNPVTNKRINYKGNDSWKVYRLKDIIK